MEDIYNLQRFIEAQELVYSTALSEIKNGKKKSHWIWFIFPQIVGLGYSRNSYYYGIFCVDEAKAYLDNPTLKKRLRLITEYFLKQDKVTAVQILGKIDVQKVCSCMTLFDIVSPHDIFEQVLDKYYEGKRCLHTLRKLINK